MLSPLLLEMAILVRDLFLFPVRVSLFKTLLLLFILAPFANGPKLSATFDSVRQIAADTLNNLYVSDSGNYIIRKIDTEGIVSTIGGRVGIQSSTLTTANNGDGGSALSATFRSPNGICVNGSQLWFTDQSQHWIRGIDLNDGIVSTLAGRGTSGNKNTVLCILDHSV